MDGWILRNGYVELAGTATGTGTGTEIRTLHYFTGTTRGIGYRQRGEITAFV